MKKEVYKIQSFINNSFEETLKEFVIYIKQKYDIEDVISTTSRISPDSCMVGSGQSPFHKPENIFVTLTFMSGWTNSGGFEFCTCKLQDNTNIYIRWDTSGKEDKEFDIKFIRKMKLQKLSEYVKF
mgnify:CR=1 FL=1